MPKFKFSNSAESTHEVTVLPCQHMQEHTHQFSAAEITTQFDKNDDWVVRLTISGSWFSISDLDELIALIKAAKKRGVKNETKRASGGN